MGKHSKQSTLNTSTFSREVSRKLFIGPMIDLDRNDGFCCSVSVDSTQRRSSNVVGLLVTFCWGLINGSADSGSIHLDLRSLPNTIGSSGVLLKMEVGIRKGAWRRA